MSSQVRLSADGLYYWDGRQWVSALSADGRSRWDGTRWVPVALPAAPPPLYMPMPVPPPVPRAVRLPTSWTRPLQLAVAVVFALYGLYTITAPFWMFGPMNDYMRQTALQQAQQMPEIYPDPNQYANTMSGFVYVGLGLGVVLGVAIATVAMIGAIRRWTWMYYAVLVVLGLQVLALPFQIASATGLITTSTMRMPAFVAFAGAAWGLVAAVLGGWMLVALLTRGPWAMRRPLPGQ